MSDADAYAPPAEDRPASEFDEKTGEERWRVATRRAHVMLGIGFVALVCAVFVAPMFRSRWVSMGVSGLATALLALAVLRAVVALYRIGRATTPVPVDKGVLVTLFPLFGGAFLTFFGAAITMWASTGFARGRQLRSFGRVLLPAIRRDTDWARNSADLAIPDDVRNALAARWRWSARTEHASVAAFAQLTLDLLAYGAPARLVTDANRDQLDEIRHAEACFALARGIDGKPEGPAPFPEARPARRFAGTRTLALAALAVDSLVDGVLHEGLSARVLAKLAKRCEIAAIRDVVKQLAADEGRHAAHAWDVVAWCVEEGGAPVLSALRGAVAALPARVKDDLPLEARNGAWERYGVPGTELEAEEYRAAVTNLTARVHALEAPRRAA